MAEDKRRYHRLSAQVECKVCWSDKPALDGTVRDVSLAGVFVCCDNPPPVATPCQVVFVEGTPDDLGPIQGEVSRVEADGMAIEFAQVPDQGCTPFLESLILDAEPS